MRGGSRSTPPTWKFLKWKYLRLVLGILKGGGANVTEGHYATRAQRTFFRFFGRVAPPLRWFSPTTAKPAETGLRDTDLWSQTMCHLHLFLSFRKEFRVYDSLQRYLGLRGATVWYHSKEPALSSSTKAQWRSEKVSTLQRLKHRSRPFSAQNDPGSSVPFFSV